MSGRKPFADLKNGWSEERKARVDEATQRLIEEYDLAALRDALGLTQTAMAEGNAQGAIRDRQIGSAR